MTKLQRYVDAINTYILHNTKTEMVLVEEDKKYQARIQLKEEFKVKNFKTYTAVNIRYMTRYNLLSYLKLMLVDGMIMRASYKYKEEN